MTLPTLNRQQSRRLDALAIERYGMTGLVLMENAGRGRGRYAVRPGHLRHGRHLLRQGQ